MWGAVPVFADIDPNHYNITPDSIKSKITPKTKAIIVVHIFGCPADMDEIMQIAKENNIKVIEDASQSPGALYKGKKAGTIGDIGIFSLNVHKHIQSGEGGVCATDDDELAVRLQLLRNHSEAVVGGMGRLDLKNMYGFNFRITEIQAAIASAQLEDRLDKELLLRQEYATIYDDVLTKYDFIETTKVEYRTHAYYIQGFRFLKEKAGVTREKFVDAVCAELDVVEGYESDGVQVWCGYTKPLYKLPIFNYNINLPVVEDMYSNKLFLHDFTKSSLSRDDMQDVIDAYQKVCENIDELK
jgi:dTDP-4-amino-4,6-dideoxygalactose transaminase